MSNSIQDLISRAATFGNYISPVAYNSNYTAKHGYWLCKRCTMSHYPGRAFPHNQGCPIQSKTPGIFWYIHSDMIFVLGDKEKGGKVHFLLTDIEKIKEFAKSKL